eukprot:10302151-Lingulodinium_polyedra.AAC.1
MEKPGLSHTEEMRVEEGKLALWEIAAMEKLPWKPDDPHGHGAHLGAHSGPRQLPASQPGLGRAGLGGLRLQQEAHHGAL